MRDRPVAGNIHWSGVAFQSLYPHPMLTLPVELVDYIISDLDRNTLRKISQAHPILCCIAERHLFADITVQNELQPVEFQHPERTLTLDITQLLSLFSYDAHIAKYILSLTIHAGGRETYYFLQSLSSILPLLQQLKKIELFRSRASTFPSLEWWSAPRNFRGSFMNALRLSTMKEIRFVGSISIPISLLNGCQSIKRLSFIGCYIYDTSDSPYPSLESLSVHDVDFKALERIVSWASKRRLQSFAFGQETDDNVCPVTIIEPLFRSCFDTLTNVEIDLGWFCKPKFLRIVQMLITSEQQ